MEWVGNHTFATSNLHMTSMAWQSRNRPELHPDITSLPRRRASPPMMEASSRGVLTIMNRVQEIPPHVEWFCFLGRKGGVNSAMSGTCRLQWPLPMANGQWTMANGQWTMGHCDGEGREKRCDRLRVRGAMRLVLMQAGIWPGRHPRQESRRGDGEPGRERLRLMRDRLHGFVQGFVQGFVSRCSACPRSQHADFLEPHSDLATCRVWGPTHPLCSLARPATSLAHSSATSCTGTKSRRFPRSPRDCITLEESADVVEI
jgi:hypothetical protein